MSQSENGNGQQAVVNLDLDAERDRMNALVGLSGQTNSGRGNAETEDHEPVDDPDDDDPSFEHSQPRFWEQGSSHILFIGIATALAIGLILTVFNSISGGGSKVAKTNPPTAKNDFFGTVPKDGTGDWKTQAALAEQKAQFQNRPKPTVPPKVTVVKPVLPRPTAIPRTTYFSRPIPVAAQPIPVSAPATVYNPPAPSFTPTATNPLPPPPPPSFDEVQKKWEALGKVASWGASDNGSLIAATPTAAPGGYTPAIAQGVQPTAQLVSAPAPAAVESAILSGIPPKSIQIGTRVPGKLETPIVFQPPAQGTAADSGNFVVSLKKPLKATDGSVVLPEGSQLIVKVDTVGSGGLMQLSAISANTDNGEIQLPQGAIEVRGNQGKPLIAKDMNHKGGGFLRNLALFALGGVSRGAELFNQADQSVVLNGTSTIVTTQNQNPNFLAGVLEGGTQAVIPGMTQSLQTPSLNQNSPLWSLNADTPVEIFVNQSVSI
ncbi:MAG: TrbI/VirB10 family protein [Thermosynechococcaceae cyanobacterium]